MSKGTIYTIILSGEESVKFRELVSEYYDVIVKTHHSPDGEQVYCDIRVVDTVRSKGVGAMILFENRFHIRNSFLLCHHPEYACLLSSVALGCCG